MTTITDNLGRTINGDELNLIKLVRDLLYFVIAIFNFVYIIFPVISFTASLGKAAVVCLHKLNTWQTILLLKGGCWAWTLITVILILGS